MGTGAASDHHLAPFAVTLCMRSTRARHTGPGSQGRAGGRPAPCSLTSCSPPLARPLAASSHRAHGAPPHPSPSSQGPAPPTDPAWAFSWVPQCPAQHSPEGTSPRSPAWGPPPLQKSQASPVKPPAHTHNCSKQMERGPRDRCAQESWSSRTATWGSPLPAPLPAGPQHGQPSSRSPMCCHHLPAAGHLLKGHTPQCVPRGSVNTGPAQGPGATPAILLPSLVGSGTRLGGWQHSRCLETCVRPLLGVFLTAGPLFPRRACLLRRLN